MACVGIDPGIAGALVLYDNALGVLDYIDMPSYMATVGKKKRARVDSVGLLNWLTNAKALGADFAMIEQVGGRPKQGASSAFVFGHTVGLIWMACVAIRLPVDAVAPQTWKKILRVPGGKEADDAMIMQRADDMMPDWRHVWRGERGGRKLDMAEAAMLAYYGEKYAAHTVRDVSDAEFRMVYDRALGTTA